MKLIPLSILALFACASAQSVLDGLIPKDLQVADYMDIKRNDYQANEVQPRSDSLEAKVENFLKSNDVTFKLPILGTSLTFEGRNLDNDEVNVKLHFNNEVDARGKKSKLKKIFVPIFVFVLIKAMVLIPLALGILAIKTWNALQLSFVSFVVALALGVWNLCKKVAGDHNPPQIVAAHNPWEASQFAARSTVEEAQQMAYGAYKTL